MAPPELGKPPPERGIYCNRTLNMRSIKAIGYDMDYTLIHYRVEEWERQAYVHIKQRLLARKWPVESLEFDPTQVIRGLVLDLEEGNLVKANRFGFVKKAMHGTRTLDYDAQRRTYARQMVDLSRERCVFLNTLFSLSEASIYAQLVDLYDAGRLPPEVKSYSEIYKQVRVSLDAAHMEGELKAEILADPDRFVLLDEETPLALLDQKHAGKKLLLVTNSEWGYTAPIMRYAFDKYLPKGMTWRELFDVIIVGARKPDFFTSRSPLFEVATEEGLLRPSITGLREHTPYFGGSASQIEKHLGLSGDEILYVGDHMYGDVLVSKDVLRWRTALILRELEDEVVAVQNFRDNEIKLARLMEEKEALEAKQCAARLLLGRKQGRYGPPVPESEQELQGRINALRTRLDELDAQISPLARTSTELSNPTWGLLMRAGNDKSHLARQVERYADIYTSRVSNLLYSTPYVYLRSPRGSLPHDPALPAAHPTSLETPEQG